MSEYEDKGGKAWDDDDANKRAAIPETARRHICETYWDIREKEAIYPSNESVAVKTLIKCLKEAGLHFQAREGKIAVEIARLDALVPGWSDHTEKVNLENAQRALRDYTKKRANEGVQWQEDTNNPHHAIIFCHDDADAKALVGKLNAANAGFIRREGKGKLVVVASTAGLKKAGIVANEALDIEVELNEHPDQDDKAAAQDWLRQQKWEPVSSETLEKLIGPEAASKAQPMARVTLKGGAAEVAEDYLLELRCTEMRTVRVGSETTFLVNQEMLETAVPGVQITAPTLAEQHGDRAAGTPHR